MRRKEGTRLNITCPSSGKANQLQPVQVSPASTMGRLLDRYDIPIKTEAVACTDQVPCQNGGKQIITQGNFAACECPFGIRTRYCDYKCKLYYSNRVIKFEYPLRKLESSRTRIAFTHSGTDITIVLASDRTKTLRKQMAFGVCENGQYLSTKTAYAKTEDLVRVEDKKMICDGTGENQYWIDFKDLFYQMGHIGDPDPILQWKDFRKFRINYVDIKYWPYYASSYSGKTYLKFDVPCKAS
ncbi:uncharacterized protein LOC121429010 [Lytechinus variegatus]|uniref:uncharacterized protein LOC121429010 n=1 Tax=Lytechinus variegatus TaxID=7654 RepID=UPI001BB2247F|nr:uncharacterized protein LOC121429010 [Lytechinus variegatus]